MSLWTTSKSARQDGSSEITTLPYVELILFGAMFGIPLVLVMAAPLALGPPRTAAAVIYGLLGSGLALFLVAKISVVRDGTLFSFGSRAMSSSMRRCYRAGYVLSGLGSVLAVGTLRWWAAV